MTQEHEDDMQAEGEMMDREALGTYEILSNCCGAMPLGEVSDGEGRCSDCKEMATFGGEDDDN